MQYYKSILENLSHRSTEATIGLLGAKSPELRTFLRHELGIDLKGASGILSDPVFEAVFPWKESENTMNDLVGTLLSKEIVDAMANPLMFAEEHTFPANRHPYVHQISAWRALSDKAKKSIIVTSGTGSGKTECFMVPILDELASQLTKDHQRLEGVQALFIYPLNALINSQRERLSAWTSYFNGKLRFCLYNGNTPEDVKAHVQNANLSEVMSREGLRASPPPILITNSTMLEYMLIRNVDQPILEKSKSKLKYIVLDEAHSYIGSQAAELSLLIRRALHAFGVSPGQVRFIATSATIGNDQNAKDSLKQYLSDLAGISQDNIEVIEGSRCVPGLSETKLNHLSADQVLQMKMGDIVSTVRTNKMARQVRNRLLTGPQKLSQLAESVFGKSDKDSDSEVLKWIDICSSKSLTDFLPLRGHFYHRIVHGLWACVNPSCKCKDQTPLKTSDWRFGLVYTYQRTKCECGSPVFEIVICNECNSVHLAASSLNNRLVQSDRQRIDEFTLESEDDGEYEDDENILEGSTRDAIVGSKEGHDYISISLDTEGNLNAGSSDEFKIHLNDTSRSCAHCGFRSGEDRTFRHAYFGGPFYISQILPTLLENCKVAAKDSSNRPFQGRSLITFTDSRQGTARISAKVQQDAERMRTRGLILEHVLALEEEVTEDNSKSLLESLKALNSKDPNILAHIKQLEITIKNNDSPVISWAQLVDKCQSSQDIYVHMFDYYRGINPDIFNTAETLTKILLTREFGRRPKKANSPETMGLIKVEYQGMDKVKDAPAYWIRRNLMMDDWKNFLKICLDFYVRAQVFVEIPTHWLNWLGSRVSPKFLLPPNAPLNNAGPRHQIWPKYDRRRGVRQHRLIRLLSHALDLDLEVLTKEDEDFLNESMYDAWISLTHTSGILQGTTTFRLPLEKMQFKRVSKAWQCPVTLKVLDVTLKGYTPFLPIGANVGSHRCTEITLPKIPKFFAQEYEERLHEIRQWSKENNVIGHLRHLGIWTNQSDRILEGGAFFRAAEHSAQQPPERLKHYEEQFKQGRLNVLGCSTTMEMGVDIGGLSMVVNNNVPPHPANYLQRAGRAGRRRETRSLVLTLCRNDSHDQAVFHNPQWPFNTALKKPSITLNSERIVQRHLNALIFTFLLNEKYHERDKERIKLECAWFFISKSEENSICQKMCHWLDEMISDGIDSLLQKGIRSVVASSVLDGMSMPSLIAKAREILMEIESSWMDEFNQLTAELERAEGAKDSDPYKRRIINDLERLKKEYLLTELVARGFLPSYGFPTGIASFNPYNIEAYRKGKKYKSSREDNTQLLRALPSRNLSIAIREYAPGADIVLDGLVYKSEGLTLNWHLPQNDSDVKENQKLRNAWRCEKCGTTGISGLDFKNVCTSCGEPIALQNKFEFIQPAGFATGFYTVPTNDISTQQYIPIAEPRIHASGELRPLPNALLGQYRASQNGSIFYYSEGEHGNGYALCFECGRAESMPSDDSKVPRMVDGHDRLRGKQEGDRTCPGTPNRIKTKLRLGYQDKTDVFELVLMHPQMNEYLLAEGRNKESNFSLAWTLAAAFRQALSSILGINTEELGFTVRPNKIDRKNIYTICIFDNCGGGAGFASSAPQFFDKLFEKAKEFLQCPSNCSDACEHCLLQHDSRKVAHLLDRHKGLTYLSPELLKSISLPDHDKLLGDGSVFCSQPFFSEVDVASRKGRMSLIITFGGDVQDWNISGSSIKKKIINYSGVFESVTFLLTKQQLRQLDDDQKRDLYSILSVGDNIRIKEASRTIELPNNGSLIGQVYRDGLVISFATTDSDAVALSDSWGKTEKSLTVWSIQYPLLQADSELSKDNFLPKKSPDSYDVDVFRELNGKVKNFGRLLLQKLLLNNSPIERQINAGVGIRAITYSDKFISSPLQILLVSELLKELVSMAPSKVDSVKITSLNLAEPNKTGYRRTVYNNWYPDEDPDRMELLQIRLENRVRTFDYEIIPDRKKISHARILTVEFENGQNIRIRFDQGVGYWNLSGSVAYPFEGSLEDQAKWMDSRGRELEILNNSDLPTHVFISVLK